MEPETNAQTRRSAWVKIIVVALAAIAFVVAARSFGIGKLLDEFLSQLDKLGSWAAILFIIVYVVATVFLVPASILTLGAGAYFGLAWGSIWVSIASTLGATCAFLVGRYLARDWVDRQIEGNNKFAAIDEAVATEGWRIVALTRLSPAFPFNLLNYAYGLTKVRLLPYVVASWIAMMPGTVMYVYLGSLAKAPSERNAGQWALLIVGLLATIAVTVLITKSAKKALDRKLKP